LLHKCNTKKAPFGAIFLMVDINNYCVIIQQWRIQMAKKPYPYIPTAPRSNTKFERKWGISAIDLAKEEGVTASAIQMRIMNYGNPFQRKKAPTMCEVMTGKTSIEIAKELNISPVTVYERLKNHGDAYYESEHGAGVALRGRQRAAYHWTETKQAGTKPGCKNGWLSPRHEDYHTWRFKMIQQYCPTAHDYNTKEANNECENTDSI
jgi:hypothetical protein